ncbi:MAG: tyrosine-type recombinase/integrase [Gammaproteobacteria bacterium]|nr:tyrosine-type recombinase/integrase [Gammaproteobacteria bacterium]
MQYQRKVFERFLTREQERQLFKAVKSVSGIVAKRDCAFMQLLRHSGIRVGALAGLTVYDARRAIKDHVLRVRADISKGQKAYKVRLAKPGVKALKALLKVRKDQGHCDDLSAPLLMSRQGGQCLSVRSIQDRIKYWREFAGLDVALSAHWFRHTFGQRIMDTSEARDPQAIVMLQLGHSDRKSTQVYTLPTFEEIDNSMEQQG